MKIKPANPADVAPRDKYGWAKTFSEFMASGLEVAEVDTTGAIGGLNNMVYEARRMSYISLYPIQVIKRGDKIYLKNTSIRREK